MKKRQGHLICIGLLLTLALGAYTGCSGGGGGSLSTSSVKGTTSGLLGTVVLQNNGTDDLVVNSNETFRFPTRVNDGTTCNITILSQPVSPAQTCDVVNGSNRMVNGSDITDVQVSCQTIIEETFDNGELDSGYWQTSGEYDRKLVGGQLQFNLAAAGEFAFDHLPFMDPGCGEVSADVTITDTDFTGTGDKAFLTRLQSCGYHAATDGEALGNRTGDVDAAIIWNGTQAFYMVFRCLNDDCNTKDSVEYLTSGSSGGVLLGTAPLNSTATLLIDWNSILAPGPGQFTFQLNNEPSMYFDPVAAGATIAADVPNKPGKYLGVQIALSNPNDQAEMTVTVDNVIDGLLSDNFDSGNYLDGSFWKKTNGRRQIENGRLVLETGKEFVADFSADNRFHNTTLISNYDMILNDAEVVEADITLDSATFVVDNGGNPAEVYALLEMEFRPPGSPRNDYTNFFVIQAALKEDPLGGVTAEMLAEGCADYACASKYTIEKANQSFPTPVVKDQAYHMKIEHLGNGVIDVTLDSKETLSVDLAAIAEFSSTEFSAVRLSTAARGTDIAGEEAFIRAFFDNVQAGTP